MKNITVDIQGIQLQLEKIPAIPARQIVNGMNGSPDSLLPLRAYIRHCGLTLDNKEVAAKLPNWEILSLAESASYEYNFGFLASWKPHFVPAAMAVTKYTVAESKNVDPVVAALVTSGFATYLELRDSLSLEEAFKLMDVLTVKRINEFRSAESAKK